MAYARSMAGRSTDPAPKEPAPASKSHSPGKAKDEKHYTGVQSPKTPKPKPTHEPISRPGNVSASRPSAGTQQGRPSTSEQSTKTSSQTLAQGTVSPSVATSKPKASASQPSTSIPVTENSQHGHSAGKNLKSPVLSVAEKSQSKKPVATGPQASQASGLPLRKDEKAEADLLLNVTVSPPSSDESISSRLGKMTLSSPGIKELQGIDFHLDSSYHTSQETLPPPPGLPHPAKNINSEQHRVEKKEEFEAKAPQKTLTPAPPGLVHPGEKINFDQFLSDKNKPQDTSCKKPTAVPSNSQIETWRREISDIDNFIIDKSPDSLTVQALITLKKGFEAKIRNALKGSIDTPTAHPRESQKQKISASQTANPTGASSKVSQTLQQEESKEPKVGRLRSTQSTTIEKEESQPRLRPANSPTKKISSPLAAAVTAAPFVPGRMASFTQYRSRQSSASSDSTVFHQAPSTISSHEVTTSHNLASTFSHIIGDHLLPGHCNRESTQSLSNEYHISGKPSHRP